MRSILVVFLAIGCGGGGGGGGTATVDSGADATPAAFCDGTSHAIGNGLVRALGVDGQGRLLVLGTQAEPRQTLYLRRFTASGDLDPTFGDAGIVTTPEQTDAEAFAVLPDGQIVIAGGIVMGDVQAPLMIGLDANGQPNGFRATQPVTTSSRSFDKLMIQGTSYVVELDGSLARITAAGATDPTFGSNGEVGLYPDLVAPRASGDGFVVGSNQLGKSTTYNLTADGVDVAGSLAMLDTDVWALASVLPDAAGTTLVGQMMTSTPGNVYDLVVGRILANGTPDPTLGANGFAVIDGGTSDQPDGALVLPDGSVLIAVEEPQAEILHVTAGGTIARTIDVDAVALAGVTVWNGMWTIAGNTETSGIVACVPAD